MAAGISHRVCLGVRGCVPVCARVHVCINILVNNQHSKSVKSIIYLLKSCCSLRLPEELRIKGFSGDFSPRLETASHHMQPILSPFSKDHK